MTIKKIVLILGLISNCAFATDNIQNTQTQNTISQNTEAKATPVGTAKEWELNETEWSKYLKLMNGPSGHYYANLSPPEILGIQAETNEELQHYAKIAAQLEHDKLEKELRFNRAFHEAAAQLYSTEPLIKPFDYTSFTPIPRN